MNFLAKNRSNYLSTENFMNCSTYELAERKWTYLELTSFLDSNGNQ